MVHYSSDSSSASEAGDSTPEPQMQPPQHNGDKKKRHSQTNGNETNGHSESKKRRKSMTKAARDPLDEPGVKKSKKRKSATTTTANGDDTRSPSPVIDFDGLSRPSIGTRERLEESPEKAAERLEKMRAAVKTILECVGEDPDREGILDTPTRYAKAMLFFTKGYQQNVKDVVNDAIFKEGHNEMVCQGY